MVKIKMHPALFIILVSLILMSAVISVPIGVEAYLQMPYNVEEALTPIRGQLSTELESAFKHANALERAVFIARFSGEADLTCEHVEAMYHYMEGTREAPVYEYLFGLELFEILNHRGCDVQYFSDVVTTDTVVIFDDKEAILDFYQMDEELFSEYFED